MKKVIIFGAAARGKQLKKQLDRSDEYSVCYFCDNNPKKWQQSLDDVKIISVGDVRELSVKGFDGIIVIAVHSPWQVVEQIQKTDEIQLPVFGVAWKFMEQNGGLDRVLYSIDIRKPYLRYFEYHVSDHCNLRCRGCGHYSNIAAPRFGDLGKYVRDLRRLKELFWGIRTIRLMGGEPLLNKELSDFMIYTRDIFPDADIMVVTNGLLIPEIGKSILKTMNQYCIRFDISLYPPTEKIRERIELRCIENEVDYRFSTLIHEFYDCLNYKGNSDKNIAYQKCESKGCHFLEDGKMAVCCLPIVYERQREKLPWKMDIGERDVVDLYDQDMDGYGLNEILSRPMDICRYCSDGVMKHFEWQENYPYCEEIN